MKKEGPRASGLSVPAPNVIDRHLETGNSANSNPDPVKAALLDHIASIEADPGVPLYVATVGGELVHANDAYRTLATINDAARLPSQADAGSGRAELPESIKGILALVQLSERELRLDEKLVIDGELHYFRSTHVPVKDTEGRIVAVAGTYVDITSERADVLAAATAEQRLHDFARAASDWFWETDGENRVATLSERLTDILGVPKALMIGKELTSIGAFVSDADSTDDGEVRQMMAAHVPFRDRLFEMRTATGEVRQFHLSGVPVFDTGSGSFKGYRGAGMDMTQRYSAERETLQARRELEATLEELTNKNVELDVASHQAQAALQAKNEFLAAMSHELRTPLNAVIGFADAMAMKMFGDLNDRYAGYAGGHHQRRPAFAGADQRRARRLGDRQRQTEPAHGSRRSLGYRGARAEPRHRPGEQENHRYRGRPCRRGRTGDGGFVARDPDPGQSAQQRGQVHPRGGKVGVDVGHVPPTARAITVWDTGIGIDAKQARSRVREIPADRRKCLYAQGGRHRPRPPYFARARPGMGGDLTFTSEPARAAGSRSPSPGLTTTKVRKRPKA